MVAARLMLRTQDSGAVADGSLPDGGTTAMTERPEQYVGLWVTSDDRIRQRLLPDGRYVEARGDDERAYTGRYEITGDHVDYWDDSGFTADGEFREDVLHHAGMVMRRAAL